WERPGATGLSAFDQPLTPAVYLATSGYGVLESSDGGFSWVRFGTGLPARISGVAADSQRRLVLAGSSNGLWAHRLSKVPAPASYPPAALNWRRLATAAITAGAALAAIVVLLFWERKRGVAV
ncbi:MAG TPA: hypothetical protein VNL71_02420, partial [Chloroflexota bacterium]|nr:hypothetical protein [Chloroflexota bacterium]